MPLVPAGGDRFRIYLKGRLRFDLLTPGQSRMRCIGDFSVEVWKQRLAAALNTADQPSKVLAPAYSRFKARRGGRPVRNLTGVGRNSRMLDNFSVRTVGEATVRAGFTTTNDRIKALANERREPFMAFSPQDQRRINEYAKAVLVLERLPKLAIQIDKS